MIIDIVIISLLCIFSAVGFKKGMLVSLFSIFSFVMSVYLTYLLLPYVTTLIKSIISIESISEKLNGLSFVDSFLNSNSKIAIVLRFILHLNTSSFTSNVSNLILNSIVFILLGIVIKAILKILTKKLSVILKEFFLFGTFDKMCGLTLGFVKGLIICCILCFVVSSMVEIGVASNILLPQVQSSSLISMFNSGSEYIIKTMFLG